MPSEILIQPNGLLAVWSFEHDGFTLLNATPDVLVTEFGIAIARTTREQIFAAINAAKDRGSVLFEENLDAEKAAHPERFDDAGDHAQFREVHYSDGGPASPVPVRELVADPWKRW